MPKASAGSSLSCSERSCITRMPSQCPIWCNGGISISAACWERSRPRPRSWGARRIVFDALDVVLALLPDPAAKRREVYRLHEWLLARELSGLITAKEGALPTVRTVMTPRVVIKTAGRKSWLQHLYQVYSRCNPLCVVRRIAKSRGTSGASPVSDRQPK